MIPIEEFTEEILRRRHDSLPETLLSASDSPTNLSVVEEVARNHNVVDEEKILIMQQLVGLVIMGFVHSYDISREINDALALNNPKLAASVADELNAKIFAPIKTELERNYRPVREEKLFVPVGGEIQKPKEGAAPSPPGGITFKEPISAFGKEFTASPPPPTPPSVSPVAGEGETPLKKEGASMPFMLHKETEPPPIQTPKKEAGVPFVRQEESLLSKIKFEEPPLKPARVELGGKIPPPPQEEPGQKAEAERTVHYGALKTPLEKPFSMAPAPGAPPFPKKTMPSPPRPPINQAQQQKSPPLPPKPPGPSNE